MREKNMGNSIKTATHFFRSHALKIHSKATRCCQRQHFTRHMILPFYGDMAKFSWIQSIQKPQEQALTASVPMGSIFTMPC